MVIYIIYIYTYTNIKYCSTTEHTITLHLIETHYITSHCIALHCITLHYTAYIHIFNIIVITIITTIYSFYHKYIHMFVHVCGYVYVYVTCVCDMRKCACTFTADLRSVSFLNLLPRSKNNVKYGDFLS